MIPFYAVCLLYVLSAVSFASDIVALVFYVSNNSICEISFFCISRADALEDTITSTSKRLSSNDISHFDDPRHSRRLL